MSRSWGRGDWGLYAAVAALSTAFALAALQVWAADWTVPWSDVGDAIPIAAHFKTLLETGWYEHQPLLGAPFGQQYHDFPTAETGNFLLATGVAHLLGDWALAVNVVFLLGFPLAGLSAAWFIRVAGASRVLTLATAVLFAILPYHFVQSVPHLFIAAYWVIPLGLVLALRAARGEPLWGRWRGVQTVLIALVVGATDTYYAVFVLIMLATGGIVAILRDRAWARFRGAVLAGLLIVGAMALTMLDDLVFGWANGRNEGAFEREPEHAEYFAFKLAQLLLPWSGHQVPALAELRARYDADYPLVSEQPALGLIPAIGFLLLLGWLLVLAVTRRRAPAATPRRRTLGILAVLAFVAFCFGMLGGIGTLVSLVTDVLRSWNRILVVIALLALAAVALAADAALERWARRAQPQPEPAMRGAVGALVAVVLLAVGLVDQTPATNAHAATAARFHAYDDYFGTIEAGLDPGDWVVQLPYQAFPETHTATGSDANDVLVPYLHTTRTGWTGGGIKGRPEADWTQILEQLPAREIPAVAAAAGASGLLLDRIATVDAWLAEWPPVFTAALGAPLESPDGRYLYWSLEDVPPEEVDAVSADTLAFLLEGREWSP